ncbi:MAG TPA: hypothetical protein VIK75_10270 [Calditerricola sp.]
MSDKPWIKFYPADWRSDPRLRMCSLGARGLWMEMLALMHEASPYGYLLVSGVAPTDAQLAVLAGAQSDQIPELLAELETAGVFSRTKEGVIYSRRMVRDEKKANHARKIGKKGGNPTLRKQREISAQDNPSDNGGDITQRPEARSQSEKTYLFAGRVIRLTERDHAAWRAECPNLDEAAFRRELIKCDAYLADNSEGAGKWFFRAKRWMLTADERAAEEKARAAALTRPRWNAPTAKEVMRARAAGEVLQ